MIFYRIAIASLIASIAATAFAMQPAVIDLNAKTTPMTKSEYAEMLACTLEKHPETTRRYAEYHLQRRNVQTWQENEKDSGVDLFFPSLEGCFEIKLGKFYPFSLDRLIFDWGEAHKVVSPAVIEVSDMKSMAECAVRHNSSFAQAYLQMTRDTSPKRRTKMRMMLRALAFPPCSPTGDIEIDHGIFVKLLNTAFDEQKAPR